jgi:hypothetical protein
MLKEWKIETTVGLIFTFLMDTFFVVVKSCPDKKKRWITTGNKVQKQLN